MIIKSQKYVPKMVTLSYSKEFKSFEKWPNRTEKSAFANAAIFSHEGAMLLWVQHQHFTTAQNGSKVMKNVEQHTHKMIMQHKILKFISDLPSFHFVTCIDLIGYLKCQQPIKKHLEFVLSAMSFVRKSIFLLLSGIKIVLILLFLIRSGRFTLQNWKKLFFLPKTPNFRLINQIKSSKLGWEKYQQSHQSRLQLQFHVDSHRVKYQKLKKQNKSTSLN